MSTPLLSIDGTRLEERRWDWIEKADVIRSSVVYVCCLEEPCLYCIKKSPKHGLGASCRCAWDLRMGKETCGECLGEWIEGHGNPMFWWAFRAVYPEIARLITGKYVDRPGFCPMMGRGMMGNMMRGPAYRTGFVEQVGREWMDEANSIRTAAEYSCALEEDCLYCIKKSPKHGLGATCSCKDDLREGKEICGECLGEWIEGHGEPEYWKYFKSAYPSIAKIIADEYEGR